MTNRRVSTLKFKVIVCVVVLGFLGACTEHSLNFFLNTFTDTLVSYCGGEFLRVHSSFSLSCSKNSLDGTACGVVINLRAALLWLLVASSMCEDRWALAATILLLVFTSWQFHRSAKLWLL